MSFYDNEIEYKEQEEYLKQWMAKKELKKKKRKERITKIKNFLGGKK